MPADISREDYFLYLEADYSKRMVEKHKDEKGFFGRIGPTTATGTSDEPLKLNDFLSNQIEDMIADHSVLDEIDEEIRKVNEKNSNEQSRTKNLKS